MFVTPEGKYVFGEPTSLDTNAKYTLTGNIKIADGTQGANKVLTSDANGVASWQNPTGGQGQALYIQKTEPTVEAGKSALWIQTFDDGTFDIKIITN